MPELPEVETARAAIERGALHRLIAEVDDTDEWECRPHRPGEIRAALLGRTLTGAFRRGKSIWCETSGVGRSATSGPVLGLHLGMSGRVVITEPGGHSADHPSQWDRFVITFADGGSLRLFDKRRLGRVRLDPDLSSLGPDAQQVSATDFAARVGRGRAPVKARLLDQGVLAGVGNLLADETLWQARISPHRAANTLTPAELTRLRRSLRRATRAAIANGGVHTGTIVEHRAAGRHCPRCGAEMSRATVGGRTTWWCPREQT